VSDYIKDPQALLDYVFDWSLWLDGISDFIVSADASTTPSGIIISASANTSTTHTVFLSAGVTGVEYKVRSRITTNGGRRNDHTIIIAVEDT